ncbi:hypothetical protein [uncultured Tateyamaria sp.]|uniref:hypothetical protein n=1 Tax=uncultured Tateyamaria sp. TaxID=455651 RepID=UPI002615C7D6|nr:hypothetical protein [uncultured Tateyamaria sp.]
MANTVLKFKDQTIRINYHDLAEVLAVLNQRLETASLARQVTEPWLNHIEEGLGFVLLDTSLLNVPSVISDFETALTKLSSDLRTGDVSPNTSRWNNVSNDIRQQSAYLQRMQAVIRDLRSALSLSG